MSEPTLELSKLREIGWDLWDPIGLRAPGYTEPNQAISGVGSAFIDEYDSYLLQAAGMLLNGRSIEDAADFLFRIERTHIGLDMTYDADIRAREVAKAIKAYTDTFPTGRIRVR